MVWARRRGGGQPAPPGGYERGQPRSAGQRFSLPVLILILQDINQLPSYLSKIVNNTIFIV